MGPTYPSLPQCRLTLSGSLSSTVSSAAIVVLCLQYCHHRPLVSSAMIAASRQSYRLFDRDHGGGVEPEEFRRVAAELGFVLSEEVMLA